MRRYLVLLSLFCLCKLSSSLNFDTLARAHNRTVLDTQLEGLVHTSVEWLSVKALQHDYPTLTEYADQLQRVLRPSCKQCIDYFEAVATLRSLGKLVKQIVQEDKDDVFFPVLRRSYVAVMWIMQRSRLFTWQTSQLSSNALSAMFRLYMHHTNRAKGRAVSFHHISKCGGTTMCQLAASNKCSNPSMDQERNCVLDSRLDGPVWMVAHDVTPAGASPNATVGRLDTAAAPIQWANMTNEQRLLARNISVEPVLPMWLMYTCPYAPIGRPNTCVSRNQQVQETRSTFLANERSLSKMHGSTQVCPQFINAVILRAPVPHVVSLLAEVKFRYVRQLALHHNITSWQPPGWNLTWWENLGPALVGNYATRTLIGRESFCRSAANISETELAQAVNALLAFDMVMTLDRATAIDLMISTMLGWPAMQFSKQPASRVREVKPSPAVTTAANNGSSDNEWPLIGSFDDLRQYSIYLPNLGQQPVQSVSAAAGLGMVPGMQADAVTAAFGPQSSDFATYAVYKRSRALLAEGTLSKAITHTAELLAARSVALSHTTAAGSAGALRMPETQLQSKQAPHQLKVQLRMKTQQHVDLQQQQPLPETELLPTDYTAELNAFEELLEHSWDDDDEVDDSNDSSVASFSDYDADGSLSDEVFERTAAALYAVVRPPPPPPPPPPVPKPVLEAAAAVRLVKRFWLERQVRLMGYPNITAAGSNIPPQPQVAHTQQHDQHDAHLVKVVLPVGMTAIAAVPQEEIWHAFPKHNIAFTDADMQRLEQLTTLDAQLVQMADLLMDLDTVWLQSLMQSHQYRKRMKAAATTYTACGFSGMMPLTDTVQDHVFQPEGVVRANRKLTRPWDS